MLSSRKPENSICWDFPSPVTHSRIFLPLFKCPETISTRKKIGNEIELRDLSKLYFLHSTAYRHNRKNNCFSTYTIYLKVSLKSCPTSCWCTTPTPTAGWQSGPLPTYLRLRMPKRFSKRGLINDQGPAFWCSSWLQTYSEKKVKTMKKKIGKQPKFIVEYFPTKMFHLS